jgi:hypothetical protein
MYDSMGRHRQLPAVNHGGSVRNIINVGIMCTFIPEGGVVRTSPRTALQTVVLCAGHQGEYLRVWFSGQIDKNVILEDGIML